MENKEMISYIENCISKKGYDNNVFKLETINGQLDVVWNVSKYPHLLCEYYRQNDVKMATVSGAYGLTSIIFDADAFPKRMYEIVDDAPDVCNIEHRLVRLDVGGVIEYLEKFYPSILSDTKSHFVGEGDDVIIEQLIHLFNFDDFIFSVGDGLYVVDMIVCL